MGNLWELYFDAVKKQDWEKALDSLNGILKKDSKNPQIHLKIGDVFQKAGDISGAVAAYHQSAWLLTNQGFLQKALAIFKVILRLDPDNIEAINKSKELMMELESEKMKTPLAPPPEVEAGYEIIRPSEPSAEMKFEEVAQSEEVPSAKIGDFLERTSLTEVPQESSEIYEKTKPEIFQGQTKEDEDLHIPPFLAALPEDEIRQLIGRIEARSFMPSEIIVAEGDSGDSIFVIKTGNAKVVAHILGKEIELAQLSDGDVFGEVAFLTGRPRTASVISTDKIEVIEFNRMVLEDIFERYPDAIKTLQDFYQSHLQDTISKAKSRIKK